MTNYIDGYVFPIAKEHLDQYKQIAEEVANIWKEHGALSYSEFVGDNMDLEGTLPFPYVLGTKEDEVIVFGWITFESKSAQIQAHEKVAADTRMADLIAPLVDPSRMVFDASKMAYGRFKPLIQA